MHFSGYAFSHFPTSLHLMKSLFLDTPTQSPVTESQLTELSTTQSRDTESKLGMKMAESLSTIKRKKFPFYGIGHWDFSFLTEVPMTDSVK
jgi:hypothetical protein